MTNTQDVIKAFETIRNWCWNETPILCENCRLYKLCSNFLNGGALYGLGDYGASLLRGKKNE